MSIRQIRLNSADQIRKRIGEFKGKTINIVLSNKTSMSGKLIDAGADGITLMNGRLKKSRYSFPEITELYFDIII